ncbi:hypothetical protein [Brunnivagina elsteri]|nr:hypothetical protein [Calothrix elsteri]
MFLFSTVVTYSFTENKVLREKILQKINPFSPLKLETAIALFNLRLF